MKEESLLLLSDLQKLINQVVLIDYTIIILGGEIMGDDSMTLEEQKQILIDNYINLMRIKAHEQGSNKELEYQIKITKVKLSTFGIDISELEY